MQVFTEYLNGSRADQTFIHLKRHSTAIQAKVFAIAEAAKKLIMSKNFNEKITILVDSQAVILAIQNNIVRYSTVFNLH